MGGKFSYMTMILHTNIVNVTLEKIKSDVLSNDTTNGNYLKNKLWLYDNVKLQQKIHIYIYGII